MSPSTKETSYSFLKRSLLLLFFYLPNDGDDEISLLPLMWWIFFLFFLVVNERLESKSIPFKAYLIPILPFTLIINCNFYVLLYHAADFILLNLHLTFKTPWKILLIHALPMIVFHNSIKKFVFHTYQFHRKIAIILLFQKWRVRFRFFSRPAF